MYDITIIGAGIVGLSTAHQIQKMNPDLKVLILEKEESVARHQTGHNSGVIHSGLYYKPGSLKAVNCTRGYRYLIDFCDEHDVDYEICGKIVVATGENQLPTLDMLYERGVSNGLDGLRYLQPEELKEYEPHATGVKALHVPQTGIIDYGEVSSKMAEQIRSKGGDIRLGHRVVRISENKSSTQILTNQEEFESRVMVNCAGLQSDQITKMTMGDPGYRIIPFRGEYYKLKPGREHLVKNLIYPVPNPEFPFLGVHFTRMIKGGIEAGPNAVLAFRREGYKRTDINIGELWESLTWPGFLKVARKYWKTGIGEMQRSYSKSAFTKALQTLVPEISTNDLEHAGSGVRAQACDRKGGLLDDFLILEGPRYVNVGNAPSPAATSALAIGETIAEITFKHL